jgi:hypothetical protein
MIYYLRGGRIMRNRLLRHEYFRTERLKKLTPQDFKVFLGLLCYADRSGRFILNKYKIEKFFRGLPAVMKSVDKLVELEILLKYSVNKIDYLCFPEHIWEKQRIFGQENPSTLPAPSDDMSGFISEPIIDYSKKSKPGPKIIPDSPDFIQFMSLYPRQNWGKMERSRSREIWRRLENEKNLPPLAVLFESVKAIDISNLPNPSTFLKRSPWSDTYVPDCLYCNNDRVVYGIKPDGSKGLMPCPKCQTTRQTPM